MIKIADIQAAVGEHFGVSYRELIGMRRARIVVRPRQIGMYIARQLTAHSFPKIGVLFGGRDHTTILTGVRRIAYLMGRDEAFRVEVERLMADIVHADVMRGAMRMGEMAWDEFERAGV